MHELSLLEDVRDIIESQAQSQKFTEVVRVTLEIGKLSCVEPGALRFGFDIVMKGSLAEQAELVIIESGGAGICSRCGERSVMETWCDPCAKCGSPLVRVVAGGEMKIRDLIVI